MFKFKVGKTLRLLCFFELLFFVSSLPIDLSYVFDNTTLYWGTSTRFFHKKVHYGKLNDNVPFLSIFDITAAEHGGTHIDAPIHFAKGKWSVDEIPLGNLVGNAVVVNISGKATVDRNAQLTVDDLKNWENEYGLIPDGSIVFMFSGWGKYWPNAENYLGSNTTNSSLYRFPGIHKDAATWLVENRKIKGVAVDTASIDYGKSKIFSSHQILYKENIYGLENVANLEKLPATGATVYALPMKIEGGSGGPVRILAMIENDVGTNTAATFISPAVVLVTLLTSLYIM